MSIQEIITRLSPINTKDKVDEFFQMMSNYHLVLNSTTELRLAIRKLTIQKYFIKKYQALLSEKCSEEKDSKEAIKIKASKKKKKSVSSKHNESSDQSKEIYHGSVLRTMNIFGSKFKKKRKKKRRVNSNQENKSYPISTEKSIRPIYIASGGMNKRY